MTDTTKDSCLISLTEKLQKRGVKVIPRKTNNYLEPHLTIEDPRTEKIPLIINEDGPQETIQRTHLSWVEVFVHSTEVIPSVETYFHPCNIPGSKRRLSKTTFRQKPRQESLEDFLERVVEAILIRFTQVLENEDADQEAFRKAEENQRAQRVKTMGILSSLGMTVTALQDAGFNILWEEQKVSFTWRGKFYKIPLTEPALPAFFTKAQSIREDLKAMKAEIWR